MPAEWGGLSERWRAAGVGAVVALPLSGKEGSRGCLFFASARPQPLWTEKDLGALSMFGEVVSNALERRTAEEALRASEERYRTIVDYTYDWESWIGPDGTFLHAGSSCERITGYGPDFFLRDPVFIHRLIHQEDLPLWKDYMADESRVEGDSIDFRIFRRDGRMRWISQVSRRVHGPDGAFRGLRVSMRDITDRKFMEKQMEYESLHDPLTGLPNRVLCLDRIKRAMERSKRRDTYYYAVVFMDLDRFKIINDSLGHSFGDWILVQTGERLLKAVRELDTVSRFGGDEFILLLEDLTLPREAIRIVKRIQSLLAEPFVLQDHEMKVSASFGIVLSPTDYKKPEELLQHANIAMHRVKETGRGHMKVFTSQMLELAIMRLTMESEIRRAIGAGEFFLEFQPIVDLGTRNVAGYETLVRWRHPVRGLVHPAEFVPTAEDSGLILDLGAWILRQSCQTLAAWRALSPRADGLFMSVNISGRQFAATDLVDQVRRVLAETGIPARNLKLEITETSIMERAESSVEKLNRLRQLGVTLSVDDFGTGYSSLSYLQRFPLDILKIDISFVRGIDRSPENVEIVRAIVNLAHNLGLKVVAEGIEREGQIDALMDLGCEFGQGFLFSRAVPEAQVRASLMLPA
jgi:diguanylate cyclase (GGDEF)-like protein/PAS domain S-box-containing protein